MLRGKCQRKMNWNQSHIWVEHIGTNLGEYLAFESRMTSLDYITLKQVSALTMALKYISCEHDCYKMINGKQTIGFSSMCIDVSWERY